MAKQKYGRGYLPRSPQADWRPPAEQEAWRLREEIVKQEREAAEAARAAERERQAADGKAAAEAKAGADKINTAKTRHFGIGAHFDG